MTPKDLSWPTQASLFSKFHPIYCSENPICDRTPPRRFEIFKKRLLRMNASSRQMVYVNFQNPTCPRDFPGTDFLIFRYSGPVIITFFCLKIFRKVLDLESSNLAGWNEIFSKFIFICILTPKDLSWPTQASLFPKFHPIYWRENPKHRCCY